MLGKQNTAITAGIVLLLLWATTLLQPCTNTRDDTRQPLVSVWHTNLIQNTTHCSPQITTLVSIIPYALRTISKPISILNPKKYTATRTTDTPSKNQFFTLIKDKSVTFWVSLVLILNKGRVQRKWRDPILLQAPKKQLLLFLLLVLLQGGDIELNPGPTTRQNTQGDGEQENQPTLSDIMKELKEMKRDMNEKMDDMSSTIGKRMDMLEKENTQLRQHVNEMEKKNQTLEKRLTTQENFARSKNLLFFGVPENRDETWDSCGGILKNELEEKLNMELSSRMMERVRRIGKKDITQLNKPRPILASFWHWQDKELIQSEMRKQKPKDFFVTDDLSPETLKRQKPLKPYLTEAKKEGYKAYIRQDKLFVKHDGKQNIYSYDSESRSVKTISENFPWDAQISQSGK